MRPDYDYNFPHDKLQESTSERDSGVEIVPSLSPEHQISSTVKEVNYLPANVKITLKYKEKEM